MENSASFFIPILYAILCAATIALLFDFIIKTQKLKTDYFSLYDSLAGYLKSLLLAGLFIFLLVSDVFNWALTYFRPKTVNFEITVLDQYKKVTVDSLMIYAFMDTAEKLELRSDGDGRYSGKMSVRKDKESATINIVSTGFRQEIKTFSKADKHNVFTDTIYIVPSIDTIRVRVDNQELRFTQSQLGILYYDTLSICDTIIIKSHFKRSK